VEVSVEEKVEEKETSKVVEIVPTEIPEPVKESVKPVLVHGKTVEERLDEAYSILHKEESGQHLRDNFPDIVVIYVDSGEDSNYPSEILPFEYFYSQEADKTFNLCAVDRTIFICDGRMEHVITDEDMDSGRCAITPIYRQAI